jgi:hypothetical protein
VFFNGSVSSGVEADSPNVAGGVNAMQKTNIEIEYVSAKNDGKIIPITERENMDCKDPSKIPNIANIMPIIRVVSPGFFAFHAKVSQQSLV